LKKRNVLIITFDCLRPDRLGANGYRAVSTPTFDRMMGEGVTFTNTYCHGPNTWMAHSSLFTGCLPPRSGVRTPVSKISEQVVTMAELFEKAGYDTLGLPALSFLSREAGYARGFSEYRLDGFVHASEEYNYTRSRTAADTLEMFNTWVETVEGPFFAWIHYFGTHWLPEEILDLPEVYRHSYSEYAQYFDGKIVYADEKFLSPLVERMQSLDLLDDTILVLASDHGEDLAELELTEQNLGRSEGHNWELKETVMRILLTIRAPGVLPEGQRRSDVCRAVDILPTLLDLSGLEMNVALFDGRSLVSPPPPPDTIEVYMENLPRGFVGIRKGKFKMMLSKPFEKIPEKPQGGLTGRVHLLKDTTWEMIPYRLRRLIFPPDNSQPWWKKLGEVEDIFDRLLESGNCEFYNLDIDPFEKNNLAAENPHLVKEYKGILRDVATRSVNFGSNYATPEEEAEVEDRLNALGYF